MKYSPWNPEHRTIAEKLRARLTLYRPQELAGATGLSKRQILTAIKSGKLRAHRVNSRVFEVEAEDAARWWVSLAE